ncbi:MAG: ArsR/SmtB family transcription factor [Devosia sp.]
MDDNQLSLILKAASDGTRRQLLTTLVQQGPTRVTDLARHFDMSLNGISKHIKVLEGAGLVARRTLGREHLIEANLAPVKAIEDWFASLKSIWELRIDALDALLSEKDDDND